VCGSENRAVIVALPLARHRQRSPSVTFKAFLTRLVGVPVIGQKFSTSLQSHHRPGSPAPKLRNPFQLARARRFHPANPDTAQAKISHAKGTSRNLETSETGRRVIVPMRPPAIDRAGAAFKGHWGGQLDVEIRGADLLWAQLSSGLFVQINRAAGVVRSSKIKRRAMA